MALKIKTPPASEPLTLSEIKNDLGIVDTGDDALLTSMITAVRERAEEFTRRALITQTWTLWMDRGRVLLKDWPDGESPVVYFPAGLRRIEIPRPPLQSVAFVKTWDTADTATTLAAAEYFADTASAPGRVVLKDTAFWPVNLRPANAVEVEFAAGYGGAAAVPESLKQGMRLWIKFLFADRAKLFEADETVGLVGLNRNPVPAPVESLWRPYQVVRI